MGYSGDVYRDLSSMYEASANITPLIETMTEQIETKLNPQSLGKFTEMALQLICDSIINSSDKKLYPYTEFNTGRGFADIFVKNSSPNGHYFLIELKYLHKKNDSKSAVDTKHFKCQRGD